MYKPDPSQEESPWQGPRQPDDSDEWTPNRPYTPPPPPTYLPTPVPPSPAIAERLRAIRSWIRIPIERPIWTPAILAALVVVFLIEISQGASASIMPGSTADAVTMCCAKINGLVAYRGEWWRLITSTFLHAGLLHIASNGYALYIIGMDLEGFFGRWRFLAIYAVSALAGSVASFAFSPFDVAGVGASGAIFGLIGALAVYYGMYRGLFGRRGNLQFWNIIVVVVLNLGLGFSGFLPIDNSAHIGGLVAGALVGYILSPRYKLGEWESSVVRRLDNTNTGSLPWIATGLVALIAVGLFIVALLMYTHNFITPQCTAMPCSAVDWANYWNIYR